MTDMSGPDDRTNGDQQEDAWSAGSEARAETAPDLANLARDWITLWQSELAAMAADREMQEAWQTTLALWAGVAASALRSAPRQTSRERGSRPDGAARASPPAAAPDPRDVEIERLARHVAALEARLGELERSRNSRGSRKRKA